MLATLSQIRAWSTEHLIDAAGYWTETADRWEDVFLQMRNQAHAIAWNGAGGDGLRQRTRADFSTVSGIADQLRRAATIARNGAGTYRRGTTKSYVCCRGRPGRRFQRR